MGTPLLVLDRVRKVYTQGRILRRPTALSAILGAALVVVFDDTSNLTLVRLRMKRVRELILRSLEAQ